MQTLDTIGASRPAIETSHLIHSHNITLTTTMAHVKKVCSKTHSGRLYITNGTKKNQRLHNVVAVIKPDAHNQWKKLLARRKKLETYILQTNAEPPELLEFKG